MFQVTVEAQVTIAAFGDTNLSNNVSGYSGGSGNNSGIFPKHATGIILFCTVFVTERGRQFHVHLNNLGVISSSVYFLWFLKFCAIVSGDYIWKFLRI
ncbi:hypothetical protein PoB_003528800 [Plakobranchus ocellatus]|uniref:Uncharacterized protein n=1 Tax=Plakobranchus ocellatus TaxID=259542 RepID=A0AAV4AN96_9GAST|nr:hypothetical protein PoB_003528800 [Plakobranchus ocellatus]